MKASTFYGEYNFFFTEIKAQTSNKETEEFIIALIVESKCISNEKGELILFFLKEQQLKRRLQIKNKL